ncbi:hypothetical protein [Aureimonas leprariae]|nr:hypothetical protein [Aureimonas leprariae]
MLVVGSLGLVFATISTLFFVVSALAGFALWLPPSFSMNWMVVREAWAAGRPRHSAQTDSNVVPLRQDSSLPDWLGHRR